MNTLDYRKTKFLKSYSKVSEIEIQHGFEVAFVGYSNSGKSSVINCLADQKNLARCSKTPGRTQLINFFEVISNFRIVDLPGYGYAEAPVLVRKQLKKMIYSYLEQRKQLKKIILLMDFRNPLKPLDKKIISISKKNNIAVLILLNKCDKIKKNQHKSQFKKVCKELNTLLSSFQVQLFSSSKKTGIQELKLQCNKFYNQYISTFISKKFNK